jgi:hypothetical protein
VAVPCSEQEAINAIAIMAPNKDNMHLFMLHRFRWFVANSELNMT